MTKTFNVGDTVRRTDRSFEMAVKGGIYKVTSFQPGNLGIDADPHYQMYDPAGFALVAPAGDLVAELRTNYPKIYDDLVTSGRFGLEPRVDTFTVEIVVPASHRETEESMTRYLTSALDDPNVVVSVKKKED